MKNDRGDVNRENRNFDDTYWRERNDGAYEDTSIHAYLPRLKDELAKLKSDPEIAALHDKAVAAHRATRDRLMQQDDYRALYDHLQSLPQESPQELALIEMLEQIDG